MISRHIWPRPLNFSSSSFSCSGRTLLVCCVSALNHSKVMLLSLFVLLSLIRGLTAADTISPDQQEVSGREGQSVTLSCSYQTDRNDPWLYWYRHHSDLQAPQFILWKGAKSWSGEEHIPDGRYGSQTTDSSTTLSIPKLTLADTALYYCALSDGYSKIIFGRGTRLTVEPRTPVEPSYYKVEGENTTACLATGFTSHTAASHHPSYKKLFGNAPEAVRPEGSPLYSQVAFIGNDDQCEDPNKRVSEDLEADSVMNLAGLITMGLRVIFIKTVVFNVLITLRMWVSQ